MTSPYTHQRELPGHERARLRESIPGWGADLDPADRPSVPRERYAPDETGAHWDVPEPQPGAEARERSIEHLQPPPVFGTTLPPRGISGAVRRLAYRRYSEGRAAHWLLLLAADRVDVVEHVVGSALRGRPENPLVETGLRSEAGGRGVASRRGTARVDSRHHVLDPVVVAGPWLLSGYAAYRGLRSVRGARGRKPPA